MKNMLKIILLIVIIMVSIYAFNSTSTYSSNEDLKRVSDTINQLSLKCYSMKANILKILSI